MSLGERLKKMREEKGLTQEELGKIINVSKPSISRYEAGTNEPNNETLKKLANFFDVSLDYLMGYSDIKEPANKILSDKETTIALHNENGYDDKLPPEARKELDDFVEFLRHKYGKK